MYESIIVRGLLMVLGAFAVWAGCPVRRIQILDPGQQVVMGIVFMCGMFAIIGAVFAK